MKTDTVKGLRHSKFIEQLTPSPNVEPSELPPMERAAHCHALRAHLQVSHLDCLDLTEWGWKMDHNVVLIPIKTYLDSA